MPEFALISIVSEQAMPNVMAVLQDDRYFKYLEFIVSAKSADPTQYDDLFDKIYKRLQQFLEKRERIVSRRPPVHPYDMAAVMRACELAVNTHRDAGHEIVFNITGGTKLMATAAYLCAQQNHLEVMYVESRDRCLISFPPPDNFAQALETNALTSERRSFVEERFRTVDVASHVALYGREVASSIGLEDLDAERVAQALVVAQSYATLRSRLVRLRQKITEGFSAKAINWPFHLPLTKVTRHEREALQMLAQHGLLNWDDNTISCSKKQADFLKGGWVEDFALYQLSQSGLFHDVRGKVKLIDLPGEWDVMLTANATLVIVECKSDAVLSEQFGKIRTVQQALGGTYARSFFARAGSADTEITRLAALYGITQVVDYDKMPQIADIIAEKMGIRHSEVKN